jgi:hypothetical protein
VFRRITLKRQLGRINGLCSQFPIGGFHHMFESAEPHAVTLHTLGQADRFRFDCGLRDTERGLRSTIIKTAYSIEANDLAGLPGVHSQARPFALHLETRRHSCKRAQRGVEV